MKFKEVTLEQIKNYFNNSSFDELSYAEFNEIEHRNLFYKSKENKILDVFRSDLYYDDDEVYAFSVYKDENDDIIVLTEFGSYPLNFGDGISNYDGENVSIEQVIEDIMSSVKVGTCEELNFQKRQLAFINDFYKHHNFNSCQVTTDMGKYD